MFKSSSIIFFLNLGVRFVYLLNLLKTWLLLMVTFGAVGLEKTLRLLVNLKLVPSVDVPLILSKLRESNLLTTRKTLLMIPNILIALLVMLVIVHLFFEFVVMHILASSMLA